MESPLNISKRYVIGLVGQVGSGKSSLVDGIMGERVSSGAHDHKTVVSVAYAPWNDECDSTSHSAKRGIMIKKKYAPFDATHICVIDLHGIDSAQDGANEFLQSTLEILDVIVFITRAKCALTLKSERAILEQIMAKLAEYTSRGIWKELVIAANEYDQPDEEADGAIKAAEESLVDKIKGSVHIYPFSALRLCRSRLMDSSNMTPSVRSLSVLQDIEKLSPREIALYDVLRGYDAELCRYDAMLRYWCEYIQEAPYTDAQYHGLINLLLYANSFRGNIHMNVDYMLTRLFDRSPLGDYERIIIMRYLTSMSVVSCVETLTKNNHIVCSICELIARPSATRIIQILAERWGARIHSIYLHSAYMKLGLDIITDAGIGARMNIQRIFQGIYKKSANDLVPRELIEDIYGHNGDSVGILSAAAIYIPRLVQLSMMKYCDVIAATYVDKTKYVGHFDGDNGYNRAVKMHTAFLEHCACMYFTEGRALDVIGVGLFRLLAKFD